MPQPEALKVKSFGLTLGASATRGGGHQLVLLEMMALVLHPTRKPLVCGKGSFLLAITNVSELGVGTQSPGIWRISAIPELSLSNFLLVQTQVRNCSVTFKRQVLTGRGGSEDRGRS